ncbi:imm11 family protein [Chelativorans sp.]|uniref:imm11 family protein n=1 Tax=Chelativorans sp. TaxID=2203393 RepID=UPI0028117316|nr:DUF1629 domain-containing protein [Chelativorans sp.]
MRIYVPTVQSRQEWILPRDPEDNFVLTELGGKAQPDWRPLEMEFLTEFDDGTARQHSDLPWCGEHVLMLRPRAVEALRPLLVQYGEILPLRCAEPVWLFNVTTTIDALDEDRSRIVRFDDGGGFLDIEEHVFWPERIGGAEIFKLPESPGGVHVSSIYLQEGMVRRIGELGLKGVAFRLVWSDETPAGEGIVEYPGEKRAVPAAGPFRKFMSSLFGR